jgi:hypothetical protein
MGLQSATQRVIVFGISLTFLAVLAIVFGAIMTSLSDQNMTDLGHWIDGHLSAITGFLIGAVPSVATFLFGRRAGRKAGKTEAYTSAVATAEGKASGDAAAEILRQEAKGHGLHLDI